MSEWQPIETAPMPHVPVLVGAWRKGEWVTRLATTHWTANANYGWVTIPGTWQLAPTHWMPIPDPPKPDDKQVGICEANEPQKPNITGEK